jgi:hypothetical protein
MFEIFRTSITADLTTPVLQPSFSTSSFVSGTIVEWYISSSFARFSAADIPFRFVDMLRINLINSLQLLSGVFFFAFPFKRKEEKKRKSFRCHPQF